MGHAKEWSTQYEKILLECNIYKAGARLRSPFYTRKPRVKWGFSEVKVWGSGKMSPLRRSPQDGLLRVSDCEHKDCST